MEIPMLRVEYVGSFNDATQLPSLSLPEYCFIGRSNVGKSSIINLIIGHREMARTSKKPGKTSSINLFHVREEPPWVIADLPGYGFAQVSKSTRSQWSMLIEKYLTARQHLMCAFLLIDIRHPQMENDREFMKFLGLRQVPFCILFTKSDKLKPDQLQRSLAAYQEAVMKDWEEMPPYFVTSSVERKGGDELLAYIHHMNNIFASQSP